MLIHLTLTGPTLTHLLVFNMVTTVVLIFGKRFYSFTPGNIPTPHQFFLNNFSKLDESHALLRKLTWKHTYFLNCQCNKYDIKLILIIYTIISYSQHNYLSLSFICWNIKKLARHTQHSHPMYNYFVSTHTHFCAHAYVYSVNTHVLRAHI